MSSVFQKLNLKAQSEIVVVNAPASFEPEIAALQGVVAQRDLDAVRCARVIDTMRRARSLARAALRCSKFAPNTDRP